MQNTFANLNELLLDLLAEQLVLWVQNQESRQGYKRHLERLDYSTEEWKTIEDCNRYAVSSFGRVRNIRTKQLMQGRVQLGYVYSQLISDIKGKQIQKANHRLVASAFIPNPDNKPIVNHINHVRYDNRVQNLEWITVSENAIAAQLHYGSAMRKVWTDEQRLAAKESGLLTWNSLDDSMKEKVIQQGTLQGGTRWKDFSLEEQEYIKECGRQHKRV